MIYSGPKKIAGRVSVPGDKSITHRALIFSALGEGGAVIDNPLLSADCLSTVECLRQLGVRIELSGGQVKVDGGGLFGFAEPGDVLDVGNSGTALRVLPGFLAGQGFLSVITGDRSIRSRPIDRIIKPLSEMGGRFLARDSGRLAPLVVRPGKLSGIVYEMPVASAQVKTAIIVAGLIAEGETTVIEPVPSRDHTELMLGSLGADISISIVGGGERQITVKGGRQFQNRDLAVPGDFSSAAFFIAAGLLAGDDDVTVESAGLNPTRTGLLDVIEMMGGQVDISPAPEGSGEPVGSVTAVRSELIGATIEGEIIPRLIDELPLVALLATQATGTTVVRDAAELRVKETDRIELVATELNKMGASVTPKPDGFEIVGPTPLRGAPTDSHGDHRLAMMLRVAALIASEETRIDRADAIEVSFPDFYERLASLLIH